jgi:hypothetical protein
VCLPSPDERLRWLYTLTPAVEWLAQRKALRLSGRQQKSESDLKHSADLPKRVFVIEREVGEEQ